MSEQKLKLVTAKEIAEMMSLHTSWIYEMTRNEKIPYYEAGKYKRYNAAEVMESLKKKPQSDSPSKKE